MEKIVLHKRCTNGWKAYKWQNKCNWWRPLGQSDHFINGRHTEWISVTNIAKLNISCGSAYSIIHKDLRYHKICARWVPKQLTQDRKRVHVESAYNFCSNIIKERLSCNGLSQAMKHGYTTMNLLANVKAWSGKTHHHPGPRNSEVCPLLVKWCSGTLMGPFLSTTRIAGRQSIVPSIVLCLKRSCLHHDNAWPHTATMTIKITWKLKFELLPHPVYNPHLTSSATIFSDCSKMHYMHANLQTMKGSRMWCTHGFKLNWKYSSQMALGRSWTEAINVWGN